MNSEPAAIHCGESKHTIEAHLNPFKTAIDRNLTDIRNSSLFFSRFECIHHTLTHACPDDDLISVENGPGLFPYNAAVMMELGSRVLIKEIDPQARRIHAHQIINHYGIDFVKQGQISYAAEVHENTRAGISYWASPPPDILKRFGNSIAIDYLGRDVVAGGFLVVQSDLNAYDEIEVPAHRWETVFSSMVNTNSGPRGIVLATYFDDCPQSFSVFRRLG